MNLNYLQEIQRGKVEAIEYIVKKAGPENLNYSDMDNIKYIGPTNEKLISFPNRIEGYTYQDLISETEIFFKEKNHVFNEDVVTAFYLIFTYVRDNYKSISQAWEKMKSLFTSSNLHMFFPMRIGFKNDEDPILLKSIRIGKFEPEILKSLIHNHTTSDYYERYIKNNPINEEIIKYFLSFSRNREQIVLLNIDSLFEQFFAKKDYNLHVIIFDAYFEAITKIYAEIFWAEFKEQMNDAIAFGSTYYDYLFFREINLGEGIMIAVYTEINRNPRQGWVIPLNQKLEGIRSSGIIEPSELNPIMKRYYALSEGLQSEFMQMIKLLGHFNANTAKLLYSEGKENEAFINLWAGLDTVINDDEKNARSNLLKNRIAALTSYQTSKSHSQQYYIINDLYEKRSEFVHGGKAIDREDVYSLFEISRQIVMVLLNMHVNMVEGDDYSIQAWFEDIDELIEIGRAGRTVDNQLLVDVGIISSY